MLIKYVESFIVLWSSRPIAVGYFMSVCAKSISRSRAAFADLEQQMLELLALRRALCLAKAARNWPRGARRRLGGSGVKSVRTGGGLSYDRYSARLNPK